MLNKIITKTQLSNQIYKIEVYNPLIAKERKAGQFIILKVHEDGERIPLTIVDSDHQKGTITLIFQSIGKTTHLLAALNVNDSIQNILGPLGNPTHIEKFGTCVCIGGGVGIGPLFPIIKELKEKNNKIISILGARSKDLLILEDEITELSSKTIICTDDGSKGIKGLVTTPLKELCESVNKPDFVIAIGPPIMMKFCSETTKPYGIKTMVSLNTIMIDGTGMCGGCRVTVGDETKFVCVDGPEFDGHLVDYDNLIKRLSAYKHIEDLNHHKCHLDLNITE